MSTSPDVTAATGRGLTHAEFVYQPGERHLAAAFFELLGCRPSDRGGEFFSSFVEPAVADYSSNVFYASEVTPEQWALEQAIGADTTTVARTRTAYLERLRREPQRSFHLGFKVPTEAELDATVARVAAAATDHPDLARRVAVAGVFRPGDPGALAPNMVQAFIWTDVVAAGLLSMGQHIEVQWHLPADQLR
jgi:hypothetical protein